MCVCVCVCVCNEYSNALQLNIPFSIQIIQHPNRIFFYAIVPIFMEDNIFYDR